MGAARGPHPGTQSHELPPGARGEGAEPAPSRDIAPLLSTYYSLLSTGAQRPSRMSRYNGDRPVPDLVVGPALPANAG
jgi:hypothetical protein